MALILLSRVATGVFFDSDEYYDSYSFNTLDPDGIILVNRALDTSGATPFAVDDLVFTDTDGDQYFYNGANGVYRVAASAPVPPTYPDITTDYGLKYVMEYTTDITIREEIYKLGYEGEPTMVDGGASPFVLNRENRENSLQIFRGSGADVTLSSQASDYFAELYNGDERDFYLIHREAGTAVWTGWITPDIYRERYMPGPYDSSLRFSDGIAMLKRIDLPDINLNDFTGTISEKDVLVAALKTLYLRLDIWIAVNLFEDNMPGVGIPMEESFINMEAFIDLKDAERTPLSCYDAIEKILTTWNATLYQEDNHWMIVREPELFDTSIDVKKFDWEGTSIGTETISIAKTFTSGSVNLHNALRETTNAYKKLSVSQEFGGLLVDKNNFAINGDFEEWTFMGTQSFRALWKANDWIYDKLTFFGLNDPDALGSVRKVEEVDKGEVTNRYINIYGVVRSFSDPVGSLSTKPAPIKAEVGNQINISFKMRCNTRGSDQRLVEAYFNVSLQCGTKWLAVNDTTGEYEWSDTETRVRWKVAEVMRWEDISIPALPVPEDGNIIFKIYQIVQVGSVSKVEYVCDFDKVIVELAENESIAYQRAFYKTTNPDNYTNALPDLKLELGDALTVLSQNAKIIDGQISSSWYRPGKTPSQPLAKLIAREYLNQYQRTSYKLTGGRARTSLKLFARYEDDVSDPGTYYQFSGGTYDAKSGYWTAYFLEVNQVETGTQIRQVFEVREGSTGAGGNSGTGNSQPNPPGVPVDIGDEDDIIPIIRDGKFEDSGITATRDGSNEIDEYQFPKPVAIPPAVEGDHAVRKDQLDSKVSGTIASGQVAFGSGSNTISGSNLLFWNSANARLGIGTNTMDSSLHLKDSLPRITLQDSEGGLARIYGYSGGLLLAADDGNTETAAFSSTIRFRTDGVDKWTILETGILESSGAQTIRTSTGSLTLATAAGNGSILLSPNGTGGVRHTGTIPNATGNFATYSATGVLQQRTAAQVLSDIGAQPVGSYVPTTRTITINGVTLDLSANRTWTITNITGNAGTATALQNARTINGTSFDGSANITTSFWGTARTITIGSTGKSVNGSANVSWSLAEIGAQAALTNPVTGTIASGQVAFGSGSNTISGSNLLFWNSANARLGIGTNTMDSSLHLKDSLPRITLQDSEGGLARIYGYSGGLLLAADDGNTETAAFSSTIRFRTDGVDKWTILETGILESSGAQTIRTSTGNLTIATNGGNGNILLSPNGTGAVGIGTTPTNTLDVNGTARIRTISNATGNFLTVSATGVIQQRTASEVKTDLGLSGNYVTTDTPQTITGFKTIDNKLLVNDLLYQVVLNSTISSDTTSNIDMTVGKNLKRYLLQANLTINFSADLSSSQYAEYKFVFKQDGTGGHTVTWNSTGTTVNWQGGVTPVAADLPNEITVITIIWTGVEYLGFKSCGFS